MTVDSTGFDSYQEVLRKWIERDRGKVSTEILERFLHFPEGKKVIESLIRQGGILCKDGQNPNAWNKGDIIFDLFLLKIFKWLTESRLPKLTPKERTDVFERVITNANQISSDLLSLGLPIATSQYFTQEELYRQYSDLFAMFDLPGELEDRRYIDFNEHLKGYLSSVGNVYSYAITSIYDLMEKLANKELLESLAAPQVVSKIESETQQRVFMIRQITDYFCRVFDTPLYETTANLCVIIFDDTRIDRDIVRSALSGYESENKWLWERETPEDVKMGRNLRRLLEEKDLDDAEKERLLKEIEEHFDDERVGH